MPVAVDINGKKLLPIKEAISAVDYSRDYVTRLARERKIIATQIGRKWYVDLASLKNYHEVAQAELEIKKRQLSDERKKELALKSLRRKKRRRLGSLKRRRMSAIASLCFIVVSGFGLGAVLESRYQNGFDTITQLANVKTTQQETFLPHQETFELVREDHLSVVPEFSSNVSYREFQPEEGLLLVPANATSSVLPQEYFSDPVTVVYNDDGSSSVRRLNTEGVPFGPEIPFVLVPINSQTP